MSKFMNRALLKLLKGHLPTRILLGLFLLSLPATLFVFGLGSSTAPAKKILLHLQWEGDKAFQHLEVITPQGHAVERFDLFGASSRWPRLLHTPPTALGPTQSTSVAINENLGGLFLYDDWEGRLQLSSPAMDAPDDERDLILLIDRSGTMKREGKDQALNALARVYGHCLNQRALDSRRWRTFSFSSKLQEHGLWAKGSPPPAGLFGESRGTTALIEALAELGPKLERNSDIVIISDGETDTRDQDSLQRSFERLSVQGHALSLLSPDFSPVEGWAQIYASGMIGGAWPKETFAKSIETPYQHQPSGSLWGSRRRVLLDETHVVILRDPQGRALLSMEVGRTPLRFHAIGSLLSDPALLKEWLLKRFGSRPTLLLDGSQIQVDLGHDSLAPITVRGQAIEKVFPDQPGQFVLTQPEEGDLDFFHPETGPFRLEGLDQWPRESSPLIKSWNWRLSHLWPPLPEDLVIWFRLLILSQILLLLGLWHLNRSGQKT